MSEQKHTPGPWTVGDVGIYFRDGVSIMGNGEFGGAVATTTRDEWSGAENPAFANAHLIAAAPEMYEALKQAHELLCGRCCGGGHHCGECFNALAAIAKAEGRS